MTDVRKSGSEVLRFLTSSTDPATETGKLLLYTKLVSGSPQLFGRLSDGSTTQVSMFETGVSLTTGSVLFVNSSGRLAQDNANFFWDDTNNVLGVGNAAPLTNYRVSVTTVAGGSGIQITGANTASYSGLDFYTSSAAFAGAVGYGNSTVAITHVQSKLFQYSAGADWVFANATRNEITLGMTTNTTFVEMQSGVSAAVSSSNTVRLRYNTFGPAFQSSLNAGSYYTIPQLETSLGNGSVLFADLTRITQDNANFFWDNTNKRLGIGTNSPGVAIDVAATGNAAAAAFRAGGSAAVSAGSTGRVRYDQVSQQFQVSHNGAAYQDVVTRAIEYLSADGAADPEISTTFISGTGTDLTLANGTKGGFVKIFTVTGGSGTITPTNLADGDVLTWTAAPANVLLIWDAAAATWHVLGSPFNVTVS